MTHTHDPARAAAMVARRLATDPQARALALATLAREPSRAAAARALVRLLPRTTPDGAPYTVTNLRRALARLA